MKSMLERCKSISMTSVMTLILSGLLLSVVYYQAQAGVTCSASSRAGITPSSGSVSPGLTNPEDYPEGTLFTGQGTTYAFVSSGYSSDIGQIKVIVREREWTADFQFIIPYVEVTETRKYLARYGKSTMKWGYPWDTKSGHGWGHCGGVNATPSDSHYYDS